MKIYPISYAINKYLEDSVSVYIQPLPLLCLEGTLLKDFALVILPLLVPGLASRFSRTPNMSKMTRSLFSVSA